MTAGRRRAAGLVGGSRQVGGWWSRTAEKGLETKGGEALPKIVSGSVIPRWRVLWTDGKGERLVADQRGRILRLLATGSWWVVSPPVRGWRPRGSMPCQKSFRHR